MKPISFPKKPLPYLKIVLLIVLLFPVSIALSFTFSNEKPELRKIESFSEYPAGDFPKVLRTFPMQRDEAKKVYKVVVENGNHFLRADDDKNLSIRVMRRFYWDVDNYPWASWRWRPIMLPKGGDERHFKGETSRNDSGCGIYVVFGSYTGKALKYVWSDQAPKGQIIKKEPGKFHIIVLESGPPKDPTAWHKVTINVAEDYKKNFGTELHRNPTGFGILTDGNALKVRAACDYDDFVIASHNPDQTQ